MSQAVMTPTEVSELLGISIGALAQMRYMRRGPTYVRLSGRRIRYQRADIEKWLGNRRIDLEDGL